MQMSLSAGSPWLWGVLIVLEVVLWVKGGVNLIRKLTMLADGLL